MHDSLTLVLCAAMSFVCTSHGMWYNRSVAKAKPYSNIYREVYTRGFRITEPLNSALAQWSWLLC